MSDTFSHWLFDYEFLSSFSGKNSLVYRANRPFPYIVLDQAANPLLLEEAVRNFPKKGEIDWFAYHNPFERKLAQNSIEYLHPVFRRILWELNSGPFIRFLETLTGIEGLIADPEFLGAGVHLMESGGKLDVHADFNYQKKLRLDRRVNVIIYLNHNWKSEYKGDLELWESDMSSCVKIAPLFNRMICFNSNDWSFHGVPEPLECPNGLSRKSLAVYYYTNGRPESEKSHPHSSLFQKRPNDSSELDDLRSKRALGRLEDLVLKKE